MMHRNTIGKNKKGVIDVQFNWIFVMITGFVIFLFIISIVFSQKERSEKQAGIITVSQITTLLKGKQQASDVYSEISIPASKIEFRCEPDINYFTYRIGNSDRTALPTSIIFAPQNVETNKIIVWTQSFNTGFPVSTFSYITTPDRVFIIYTNVNDSQGQRLFNSLPANMTKAIGKDLTKYDSFREKTIICFDNDCPAGRDYIKIVHEYRGEYPYGNVTFRTRNVDYKTSYITDAGLYGAIFSGNGEYYQCQMSRALIHYDVKRALVEKRLRLMQAAYNNTECGVKMRIILNTDLSAINADVTAQNVAMISYRARALDIRNTDLGFSSCPRVY